MADAHLPKRLALADLKDLEVIHASYRELNALLMLVFLLQ